jgi:hypothetical protein
MWFNMREEPMVYINGLPFVLREQQRPMKNLQEYAGIDAERLERMEARLKQDVLAEAGALLRPKLDCCYLYALNLSFLESV